MAKSKKPAEETAEIEQTDVPQTLNKKYEEWKVKPIYKRERGDDGQMRNFIDRFEKDAQSPIRTTSITPEKAEILNAQSENTGVHLYEVE